MTPEQYLSILETDCDINLSVYQKQFLISLLNQSKEKITAFCMPKRGDGMSTLRTLTGLYVYFYGKENVNGKML